MQQKWTTTSFWQTNVNTMYANGNWNTNANMNITPEIPEDQIEYKRSIKTQIRGNVVTNG